MGLPIYEHILTVGDATVTPQGPLSCGTAGDEHAARLRFRLEAADAADYEYRLEAVSGDGAYDLTDRLPLTDGELSFDIPSPWTAAGVAAVRLVRYRIADGEQTARQYYPPVLLQFAYRDEGVQPMTAPLQWQELITRAEAVLNEAAATAAHASTTAEAAQRSLSQAQTAAEDARAAAVEAQTSATDCNEVRDEVEELSGIAADILAMTGVGDGIHHPCVTVDVALNAESDNPVTNRAVTNEFLRADADAELKLQGKAEKQHTHAATDVITSIGDTVEDTLMGLQARKAENSALIAENIAYSYGVDDTFDTVADALTYLLGKSGLL